MTLISRYLIEKQSGLDLPRDFFARLLQEGRSVILLLDGLDEVPDEDTRARVREAVEHLVNGREEMRVVVTSRTAAYRGRAVLGKGFQEVQVLPLTPEHVERLVRQAYASIYPRDVTARESKTAELLAGIQDLEQERRRRLGGKAERLVTSPLIVRMLLVVHFSERRLPEQRAELYMKAVDAMLLPDYGPDEEVAARIGRLVGDSREAHRELVQHLAFALHRRGERQGREIAEDDLRQVFQGSPYAAQVEELIGLTRLRGTVLEERDRSYRFIHLGFQEFLAARYLAEVVRDVERIAAFFESGPILDSWWREPALLVAGYLAVTSPQVARDLMLRLAGADAGAAERLPGVAADVQVAAAEVAGVAALEWQREDLRPALAARLAALFRDGPLFQQAPPALRAAAGDTLARLGDPRFRADAWYLPDEPLLGFVEVPAGPFLMGSSDADEMADDFEKPQHEVYLPTFYIARYPVTVAQFRAFVEESGHRARNADRLRGLDNHPVVRVRWDEAVAYCAWLTERLRGWAGTPEPLARLLREEGWAVRLPSEAEWEKAARGPHPSPPAPSPLSLRERGEGEEPRRWPWGNEWAAGRANTEEAGLGRTSAVGCFPGGASPYGVQDMSGNVWEWTRSRWGPDPYRCAFGYPYDRSDGREEEGGADFRVVRGGSWYDGQTFARCASRRRLHPAFWGVVNGLRVVLSPAL